MREQRVFERSKPPVEEQMVTIHGYQKHIFGRIVDESLGGLGIELSDPASFRVGERLLVHRLHQSRLRLATVRHIKDAPNEGTPVRMGVMWTLH